MYDIVLSFMSVFYQPYRRIKFWFGMIEVLSWQDSFQYRQRSPLPIDDKYFYCLLVLTDYLCNSCRLFLAWIPFAECVSSGISFTVLYILTCCSLKLYSYTDKPRYDWTFVKTPIVFLVMNLHAFFVGPTAWEIQICW